MKKNRVVMLSIAVIFAILASAAGDATAGVDRPDENKTLILNVSNIHHHLEP